MLSKETFEKILSFHKKTSFSLCVCVCESQKKLKKIKNDDDEEPRHPGPSLDR